MPDGPEQEARDKVFLSQLGEALTGPFPSRWTCPQVQPWLYGYDAFQEVRQAVELEPFQPRVAMVSHSSVPLFPLGKWIKSLFSNLRSWLGL
jgi:salicylate hydroxylase